MHDPIGAQRILLQILYSYGAIITGSIWNKTSLIMAKIQYGKWTLEQFQLDLGLKRSVGVVRNEHIILWHEIDTLWVVYQKPFSNDYEFFSEEHYERMREGKDLEQIYMKSEYPTRESTFYDFIKKLYPDEEE